MTSIRTRARESSSTDAQRDERMIRSPIGWPRWPVLPLKRRSRPSCEPDFCGFLLAQVGPPWIVYVGSFYSTNEKATTWGEATEGLPREEFGTMSALLAEWRID